LRVGSELSRSPDHAATGFVKTGRGHIQYKPSVYFGKRFDACCSKNTVGDEADLALQELLTARS
jgi:hypothetical protein